MEGITYQGAAVDDAETLARLAPAHRAILQQTNGFIAYSGGLHVRGAAVEPEWHSLRAAWEGPAALHALFPAVASTDVPFAQDVFGDQFLLRGGVVHRLLAEAGDLESLEVDLGAFFGKVVADPLGYLELKHLDRFLAEGGSVLPGQLLSVYPPWIAEESAAGVSLRAIPASERLAFLASLARQLRNVREGEKVRFEIEETGA